MGLRHGTPRLEMKPEHVLQPRPETPVRKTADDGTKEEEYQGDEIVKSPGRPNSQPPPAGAYQTPEPRPMQRPESVGSVRSLHSRNNSVVQLQTPKSPRTPQQPAQRGGSSSPNVAPRSLRRTGSRSTSADLRSAAKKPQPPELPPADLDLEHIASSSSYDPVTDKGKRPVRGMSDVIVSVPV